MSSPSPSQRFPSHSEGGPIVPHLKRRIIQLEDEIKTIQDCKKCDATECETTLARGIRKVVTLRVPLKAIVDENDRHASADSHEQNRSALSDEEKELEREQDRNFESFKSLVKLFGRLLLSRVLEGEGYLDRLKTWERHANEARSDNIKRLKTEVANWLNGIDKNDLIAGDHVELAFVNPHTHKGRGFQNSMTGRLLTPIDYNWNDPDFCQKIRDLHPDFPTHELYLVRLLYAGYSGNSNNFRKGFLKSVLLTLKHILTSSSSALDYIGESNNSGSKDGPPPSKRQCCNKTGRESSKKHDASLLGITTVTPCCIAYAAVMLHFSLTNAITWRWVYDGFDYVTFYNVIVDFFEDRTLSTEQEAKELLCWWNQWY
ncbi:hypothetical protein E1B28_010853 [Marasmius oreades]|uniref:Uncharacterized protein n=1 Tax=Marasmius oreades TaxID=181124 RepID=A0A9P7UNX8_9AGAR|nr:uncharacterized protein E1B28_010853 [Marasmius oreades]KAG7089147.1 hypothetical protein E1B28_010853 [Marasmius oreades]